MRGRELPDPVYLKGYLRQSQRFVATGEREVSKEVRCLYWRLQTVLLACTDKCFRNLSGIVRNGSLGFQPLSEMGKSSRFL